MIFKMQSFFLSNLLIFARLLRSAGLNIAPDQLADLGRVLARIGVEDRADVYYATRALFVRRHDELLVFDRAFDLFFRMQGHPSQAVIPPGQLPASRVLRPATIQRLADRAHHQVDKGSDEANPDNVEEVRQYSPDEVLRQKNFAQFTAEEMKRARELMAQLDWRLGMRRTRRNRTTIRGAHIDLARVLRRNLRYGGELFYLPEREPRYKPRPVVVLADISGSMERYTRMLLHWLHALSHGSERIEVFTFGTRLTRITPSLRKRSVDEALARTGRQVADWSGGTRIGDALKTFNFEWARRVLHGGAVVLIISDGWDRGDLQLLAHEMERLQRSCARLIWLNPLLGDSGFAADAQGMLAALPYVDDFLPVHNLASLADMVTVLNGLRVERPPRKQRPRVTLVQSEGARPPEIMPLPQMGTTNYVRRTLTLRVMDGAPRVGYEENP
jgi:uncharacterized protein with von Willebrand factor type A (vWA) domain